MAVNVGLQLYTWVNKFARRLAAKPNAQGIMQIPNQEVIRDLSNEILTKFMRHNVPRQMIKSENDIKVIYNQILNLEDQQLRRNVISPGDPRHKEITEKILGKKKTTADLIDLGLVRKGKNVKKTTPKEPVDQKLVEEVKVKETFDDFNARQNLQNKLAKDKGYQKYRGETEEQIKKRFNKQNKEAIKRFKDKRKDPEDLAQGGRTGVSYLLAEDSNQRVPLKDGHSPGRRKFLKVAAGLAALPVVGKFFKWAKPLAKTKSLTSVPIKAGVDGMPPWFPKLVNKVIKEGDDVTKKFATQERQIVHKTNLPRSDTDVIVTQDLTTGNVSVEIGAGKHGFSEGHYGQPVRLEYKASEVIEPPFVKDGKVVGKQKGVKTKEEFWVEEAEFTGGHPENV